MKLIIKQTMNIDIHLKLESLIIDKISEKDEPISKLLKSVIPAKVSARKRAENTGFYFSPELQQQTFEIGSDGCFLFSLGL